MGFVKYSCLLLAITTCISCKKYLDEKPDKKLVAPTTLNDFQAILDYYPNIIIDPGAGEASADNYYMPTANWLALDINGDRRMYTWQADNIFEQWTNDWSVAYQTVYYANTVLDGLQKVVITAENSFQWNHIKAQALMLRGMSFFQIADIWCLAYDSATSNTNLGIPLRLTTDFTQTSFRSSLQQTYDRIIADLKEAIPSLPMIAVHPTRASRAGTYGILARVYMAMRLYNNADVYADSCMQINSSLIDYNTLNINAAFPFTQFNAESILYRLTGPSQLVDGRYRIDSTLYNSYDPNDCRKTLFFKSYPDGTVGFKGSYSNFDGYFSGIATDELYLVRAECLARIGNKTGALNYLNILLQKRYKTGTFTPISANDANDALAKIIIERRKELVLRCVRWMDIKRFNKEGANITLKRFVNNNLYTLPPNDLRFALPIPEAVIELSGMQQNPR